MIEKQDIADYINANFEKTLTESEKDLIARSLTPEIAEILIKLVGDISILVHVRDNKSN